MYHLLVRERGVVNPSGGRLPVHFVRPAFGASGRLSVSAGVAAASAVPVPRQSGQSFQSMTNRLTPRKEAIWPEPPQPEQGFLVVGVCGGLSVITGDGGISPRFYVQPAHGSVLLVMPVSINQDAARDKR